MSRLARQFLARRKVVGKICCKCGIIIERDEMIHTNGNCPVKHYHIACWERMLY
jgi:hypothetical protein